MRSDVRRCERRPDPISGGRARARHKSQESILERGQTEFQEIGNPFSRISGFRECQNQSNISEIRR